MNLRKIDILQFAVTDRCNLKCIMCHHGTLEYQRQLKSDFSLDLFRGVLDDMAGNGFSARALYFFWNGEAFLLPDFLPMLQSAYSLNSRTRLFDVVYLNTNAGLLDPEKSDQLLSLLSTDKSNAFCVLNFSIDAVNEQTYNSIRRGGNFRKTVENIKYLVRKGSESGLSSLYFIFQIIVQPGNFSEVGDFAAYWSGFLSELQLPHETVALMDLSYLGIQEKKKHLINIRPLLLKGSPEFDRKTEGIWNYWKKVLTEGENPPLPELPDDRHYIVPLPELNLAAREKLAPQRRFLGGDYLRKNPCPYLFKNVLIRPDGEVSVCCRDPFSLGNLKNSRFSEIWLSAEADQMRKLSLNLDFASLSPGCVHCSESDESFWEMLHLAEISSFYQDHPPERIVSFVRTLPEEDQKLILEKALFFSESGDLPEAYRLFSMLDDSMISLSARAYYEFKTGKMEEAVKDYLKLLQYPELKNRGEVMLSLAILKIGEQKNEEGLYWLEQAEKIIPKHPLVIEQKAYLLMSADPQKALEYFNQAGSFFKNQLLTREKQDLFSSERASGYYANERHLNEMLALLYNKTGDYPKSCCWFLSLYKKYGNEHYLLEFLRILSLNPDTAPLFRDDLTDLDKNAGETESLFLLFTLNRYLNRNEICFRVANRILREQPGTLPARECALFLSGYCMDAGNYAIALSGLKKGKKLMDQETFNYKAGEILEKAGKKKQALKYFMRLSEDGLERKLALLDSLGRSQEILEFCSSVDLNQKSWGVMKVFLSSLWKTGKYQEGLKLINNFKFDKNEDYYRMQGGFALEGGEYETALKSYALLENNTENGKDRLEFLETEAYILRKLGRKLEALKKYLRLLKFPGRRIHALKAMLCTLIPGKN
ncbi:MAG: SPASM domain-containing protein [Candidatus Wallbacteria bacterium]|nr:SPASM domain-containing protein [Candidatus Wallbacteria bacterium]